MAKLMAVSWLACLFVMFVGLRLCETAMPYFDYPEDTSQQYKDDLKQALRDAMTLARFAAITVGVCDEARNIRPY